MNDNILIELKLADNWTLVAERNEYPKEIYVGLCNGNGNWVQDLAIIKTTERDGEFEVLVYADENDEDWTNKYTIKQWNGECL